MDYQKIVTDIILTLIPIIVTFLITLIRKKTAEIESKINNKEVEKYLGILEKAVESSVINISSTYVDALKKNNSFGEDEAKIAMELATNKVISILGTSGYEVLSEVHGDINQLVESLIEKYVVWNKSIKCNTEVKG
jgi:hypothetical protein